MATFRKDDGSSGADVVCTVPPAYSQSSSTEKSSERPLIMILLSAVLITAVIVGGILGLVHLLTRGVNDGAGDEINVTYDVQTVETTYTFGGVNRTQTMSMGRGSDTVSLHNHEDNFDVVLDSKRNLAVFKNLSSDTCYFTNLEDIPVSRIGSGGVWTVAPILFPPVGESGEMNAMPMTVQYELPSDFVTKATDDTVAMMCSTGGSFWVEKFPEGELGEDDARVKRQLASNDQLAGGSGPGDTRLAFGCISGWCKIYYTDGSCSGWDWCKVTVIGNHITVDF